MQECLDEILHLTQAVEMMVRSTWAGSRRRSQGWTRRHRIVDWKHRWRADRHRCRGFLQPVGPRIYLRRTLGQNCRYRLQIASPVKILLNRTGNQELLNPVDDTVGSDHIIRSDDLSRIHSLLPGATLGGQVNTVVPQSLVLYRPGLLIRPFPGTNSFRNNVEHQERLERLPVAGFKQEAFELRVKVPLQSFISGCKNGNIVFSNSFLKSLKKQSLLNEFRQFRIMGVKQSNKNGVGVDLA
ncbi:hypothetical protein SLEP1_g13894 [Rubroshorea leprosula]|uniref:Uncharacterized protein n=1 Tax=Rubroshorea leprosula TaxID=152421 RepID=A0AAV5IHE6_9ROSI|nr:hypothetical protein SLEP1_g13894 [Rubroshorea leprosula]